MTAYIQATHVSEVNRTKPIGCASARRVDSTGGRPHYSVIGKAGFGDQGRVFLLYTHHENAQGTETIEPDAVVSSGYPFWASVTRFHVDYFAKEK